MKEWLVNIRTTNADIETMVEAKTRTSAYSKIIARHKDLLNEFENDIALTITIVEWERN